MQSKQDIENPPTLQSVGITPINFNVFILFTQCCILFYLLHISLNIKNIQYLHIYQQCTYIYIDNYYSVLCMHTCMYIYACVANIHISEFGWWISCRSDKYHVRMYVVQCRAG